jgi:hypothetical protein
VIEDALVPAFIVEEHEDGQYTVFDVPFYKAVACVTRWGAGSGDLLRAIRRP